MTFRILNTMDFTSWLNRLLLVVFIFCFLDSSQLFGVDSQSVGLKRLSPGGDLVEGNKVRLQCDVSGLAAGHIIEWTRIYMNTTVIIATNGTSLEQRYEIENVPSSGISITEVLVIKNISKTETSFTCRINDTENKITTSNVSFSSNIGLYIHYFPSIEYPICFPGGQFTVQEGTEQIMSCTSEKGNPSVVVQIVPSPATAIYMLMLSENNATVKSVFSLELSETYNGYQFECTITSSYFPGRDRSCVIGPITVTNMTTENPQKTESTDAFLIITDNVGSSLQTKTSTSDYVKTTITPSRLPIAIIAGAAGGGGFLLLILITLIVLYLCRCCCFDEKSHRSSLWLTDLPLVETVQDTNTDHDIDRSEPKESTTAYQNVTDLMTENKPDPRMPPQSEPETSHLDTQDMTNNVDEAAEFISQRQFSIHSQNNDQDSPRSPGKSSFKLSRSDDRIADNEKEEHLGTVEPKGGDAPTYGVVQKSNRVSQGSKKKQPEITSDGSDPWANASSNQQETPASTENEDAEMPSLPDDPPHSQKPTAMVKPVSHTPKPPIATKPVKDHQSSRRTNTNQAPPSVAKKPIKKFKAKERNPSADETSLPPPVAPSVSPHPPPPSSPLTDHEENASVEVYGEEGGDEVPSDTQVPHEAHAADDHDVTYAELDLQSATSDAMPQPQEEHTLYASIVSK